MELANRYLYVSHPALVTFITEVLTSQYVFETICSFQTFCVFIQMHKHMKTLAYHVFLAILGDTHLWVIFNIFGTSLSKRILIFIVHYMLRSTLCFHEPQLLNICAGSQLNQT